MYEPWSTIVLLLILKDITISYAILIIWYLRRLDKEDKDDG